MKTLSETNKYLHDKKLKQKLVVDAVYSSAKIEGSKTTKKKIRDWYLSNLKFIKRI